MKEDKLKKVVLSLENQCNSFTTCHESHVLNKSKVKELKTENDI